MRAALRFVAAALVLIAVVSLALQESVARIVVSKSRATLVALSRSGEVLLEVPAIVGASPVGTKHAEGDLRTPEGDYRVCVKNPQSRFHLSLGLDYPGVEDARLGLAQGRIGAEDYAAIVAAHRDGRTPPWKTPLGGEIFIHGEMRERGSTAGCVAITNEAIEALFAKVSVGTVVTIEP